MPTKRAKENKQSPASRSTENLLAGYEDLLRDLKARIGSAQIKAALAVNRELIALYWEIGKSIAERQQQAGWGDAVLDRLSKDLRHAFPQMKGFSRRNLYRMRAIYLEYYKVSEFVPQVVAQIPWGHNIILLEKLKAQAE